MTPYHPETVTQFVEDFNQFASERQVVIWAALLMFSLGYAPYDSLQLKPAESSLVRRWLTLPAWEKANALDAVNQVGRNEICTAGFRFLCCAARITDEQKGSPAPA